MDWLFKGKDGVCIRRGKKNGSTKTAFVEWNEKEAKIFFFSWGQGRVDGENANEFNHSCISSH